MLSTGGPAGYWAHGRSGGRHFTAGQYGYIPLGRHLVNSDCDNVLSAVRYVVPRYPR